MSRKYFETLCKDRKDPFEITSELQIRKMLEKQTSHRFEFRKNDNKYGPDIECYRYDIVGESWSRTRKVFVEVEVSERWVTSFPDTWKTASFLARKLLHFNGESYVPELKSGCEDMFYLILNKSLTDGYMIHGPDAIKGRIFEPRYMQTGDKRLDTYVRFNLSDPTYTRGIQKCVKRIIDYANGM